MQYRQLGHSGLSVSVIGYGCMSLGNDQALNTSLIRMAIDKGVNIFDTADIYNKGANEETVGKALSGIRDKVILCSKAGNVWKADGSGLDWNPSKKHILEAAEQSLRRLQTDYIDLYQLHGGTIDDPVDETIEAFELLQQQGKIRFYGISSIRPNVIRAYVHRSSITSVMMQYSLLDRRPEESCLSLLQENNIGVLARGGLAQGLLAGKPAGSYLGHSHTTVRAIADKLAQLSGTARTAAQTALQFVLHQPAVSSAITGMRTREQLEEAIATADSPLLTVDQIKQMEELATPLRYEAHR